MPYRSLQYLNKTYLPTVKWTEVWVYDSKTFLNFTQMTANGWIGTIGTI